ncbi:hypothetical protein [Yinghuangia sp. YIM S09857]|uniref:hypothetical protein n=1 Tax=Yinghuangia sp. YIM S09857 TaxID=3436929 RepID=UPI003F537ED7
MRLPRLLPTAAAVTAVVLALGGLTACSGDDVDDATVDSKSGPSGPGGRGPAPGGVLPGQQTPAAPPAAKPPADMNGRELADRAVQLMAATSYRLTGRFGSGADAATLTIDVGKQRDVRQTVTRPDVSQELIRVSGVVYSNVESVIGATPGATIPANLRGTYLKTDGGQLDPKLVDPFAGSFGADAGEVAKGEQTQIDGKGVWPLTIKSADGATTTMYVMAGGDPYPIKLTVTGADPVDLKVSDFGADVAVAAPPADRVVDEATLQQRMAAAG